MRECSSTYKLRNTDKSAFVGIDAVIEDIKLLDRKFRHKRQALKQAIDQSNFIDVLQKQQQLFDKKLNIQTSEYEFSTESRVLNPEILKPNWYPVANSLIRCFVKQNISHPF